ncbi:MAG TPA: carboxymuconolactone decarboxylase family protein [Micropepsaceae bacterium]|nr:carboxymuconolactone decarboxylase family protein [Micropepsaceae bacterium]
MARVALIEEDAHPELADLMARIRGARRGRLINIYKLLLHSPALAESWFAHNNAVRWKTELDGRLRELVIIRIGFITGVDYIVRQHVPALAIPEGLTLDECEALKEWRPSSLFGERDRVVLAYADAMTSEVQVPDSVYAPLKVFFNQRGIVELTVLIGTYNMHARVLQALEIDPQTPA